MQLIETHAHLDLADFDADRPDVLSRARAAGVQAIINIALHPEASERTLALAEAHGDIYAAVGIHPHAAGDYGDRLEEALASLRQLARHPRVVALGEMGLDFYRDYAPRDAQQIVFEAQLDLARTLGLPVIIHNRAATREVFACLERLTPPRVVLHCFAGDVDAGRWAADRGFYIGVGGTLTYPRADALRQVVQAYPRDRVVLETDCPFLAPQPRRGRRNEPSYLVWVVEALAALWGLAAEEVAALTTANACRLFGIEAGGKRP